MENDNDKTYDFLTISQAIKQYDNYYNDTPQKENDLYYSSYITEY